MLESPRRWILALALSCVAGLVGWLLLAPRGVVITSGEVAGKSIWDVARLDYGGQSDSQHYIRLHGGGYFAFFKAGRDPAGSVFLSRSADDAAVWHCGRVQRADFGFRDGLLEVGGATQILDEQTASREGTMTVSGFGGSSPSCSDEVTLTGAIEGEFRAASFSSDQDLRQLRQSFVRDGEALEVVVLLSDPKEDQTRHEIERAWVRHVTYGESTAHQIHVAGPGSALVDEGPCARLELTGLTAPASCPPSDGDGDGQLEYSW